MDKIRLKFNYHQICAIDELLAEFVRVNINQFSEQQKVVISIGRLLATKFHTRRNNLDIKLSQIKPNEKFQFTLLYFQVWALKTILINNIACISDEHQKFYVQKAIDQLDKNK